MSIQSFSSKVKSFLKGGDSRKLNSFYSKVITKYNDELDLLKRDNALLEEKIQELKESKLDEVFNINLEKLASVESREQYSLEYAKLMLEYDANKIIPLQKKIEGNTAHIKQLQGTIKFLEEAQPVIETDED